MTLATRVGLVAAAVLAHRDVAWWWAGRVRHASEDRRELVALGVIVAWAAWSERARAERAIPRGALLPASLLVAVELSCGSLLDPLVRAALLAVALASLVAPLFARVRSSAGLLGLFALALPAFSLLQYQLGQPLRAATTRVAAALLRGSGVEVEAVGTCLAHGGELVAVDAPCSGLSMLWATQLLAFTLCAVARASWPRTAATSALAAGLSIAANAVRTTSLFHVESGRLDAPPWFHPAIGLAVQALVAAALVILATRTRRPACALEPST